MVSFPLTRYTFSVAGKASIKKLLELTVSVIATGQRFSTVSLSNCEKAGRDKHRKITGKSSRIMINY
jgi:hypothetical protein